MSHALSSATSFTAAIQHCTPGAPCAAALLTCTCPGHLQLTLQQCPVLQLARASACPTVLQPPAPPASPRRPDAAAAAQLLVCPAGCAAGKQATLPYLQAIGRAVLDVGPVAQASSALKLKGNFMLVSSIEMLAEAMALGDKAGVSRQQLLQVGAVAGVVQGSCCGSVYAALW